MPVKLFLFVFSVLFSTSVFSQKEMIYEPSKEFPFGQYNPSAPTELKDYQDLIGTCKCMSESRNPDPTWAKPVNMIWTWKYIMNGTAVQDETLKDKIEEMKEQEKEHLEYFEKEIVDHT